MGLAVLATSLANVALPVIARSFQVGPSSVTWVVGSYQFAATVTLLPLSALGELFTYRRVFLFGMAIFLAASLGCVFAPSLSVLVLSRGIQGIGAAAMMGTSSALIRFIYPAPMLPRGMGSVAAVVALASAAGPPLASAMLAFVEWRWLFSIGLLGASAFLIGWRTLPGSPRGGHKFDLLSAVLYGLSLGAIVLGVDLISRDILLFGSCELVGIVVGACLVWRQRFLDVPLLPFDLLRRPLFSTSIGASACCFAAQMLAFVSLPFLLQVQLGLSVVETGLLMTPWPLATVVMTPIAARLCSRGNLSLIAGCGLLTMASGLVLTGYLVPTSSYLNIVWRLGLAGLGFGLFQLPNNTLIIGAAPAERVGSAGGLLATARLLGQTVGAAVAAVILSICGSAGSPLGLKLAGAAAVLAAIISVLRSTLAPGR
ncbi:MFS transporter [Bradyrhizobium genosp. P]|uniref:MFS transporter n=1 Tax=Bradyrhizobium genosp. P TaxID=83641 RepID=UPI003CF801A5